MDFRTYSSNPAGVKRLREDESSKNCVTAKVTVEKVEFLYRLVPGICSRSYGVEVAAKAGLPPWVVAEAAKYSRKMQESAADAHHLQCLKAVMHGSDVSDVRSRLRQLKGMQC